MNLTKVISQKWGTPHTAIRTLNVVLELGYLDLVWGHYYIQHRIEVDS